MSQLNSPLPSPLPAQYLRIEEQLDTIGQRWRLVRILRGLGLWIVLCAVPLVAAAFAANSLGQGKVSLILLLIWAGWTLVSAVMWVVQPLLMRPPAVQVARMVESRVQGLHNGLTNSVLLAKAGDLRDSPFLPHIFDEVLAGISGQSLDRAVRIDELRPLFLKLGGVLLAAVIVVACCPSAFAHGWQQLFNPSRFVPTQSSAKILELTPGDVTLIAAQPLEISVRAEDTQNNDARLIFDNGNPPVAMNQVAAVGSTASTGGGGVTTVTYTYRQDHVDRSLKYRAEVGGTQTPWYTVTVVRQVKLEELSLAITPPAYALAHAPATTLNLKLDQLDKTPVNIPIGSRVKVSAGVDVPCNGAMLQLGDAAPVPMNVSRSGQSLAGEFILSQDAPLAILMTEGASGQVIARLPEQTLSIHAIPDAPPVIEMKWPMQDTTVAPDAPLTVHALLKDDYGLTSARVLLATTADAPLTAITEQKFTESPTSSELSFDLPLKPEQRAHGRSVRIQLEATDNRDLPIGKDTGPQTTSSNVFEIRFRDPTQEAKERKEELDKLRAILSEMLKKQQSLHDQTLTLKLDKQPDVSAIHDGQAQLQSAMTQTASAFPFEPADRIVQKTLQMLAANPAQEAIDLSASLGSESLAPQRQKLSDALQSRQRRIISTLESLLAVLGNAAEAATQPSSRGGQLDSKADAYKKLDEALKEFMNQQKKILDQTANLAKKNADRFDDNDKKKLDELAMAQEKLDAFMEQKLSDFAKLAEQDQSNGSTLKDLTQAYSEVTMAKDALKKQAVEMAIPAEESGLELAQELSSNIERWLSNQADRQNWNMEDPLSKQDLPMPELPKELEDMIGDLQEQQEDLFDQMEDANANWADSADKGIGWDAGDGPIADMSAKGVTGNQLPNNNEMNGRSGEGRSGKSNGEFVGDSAVGKGGRNTPTRLDPTPFAKGQISDTSKDPVGGATGGGKMSGQGGEGLEGPVPPAVKATMQRLAQKQAQIRNTAERLNLQYGIGRYDNFKLEESTVMMRQVESDLEANRYTNAMRRRDVTLDTLDTSRLLLGGEIHVQQDTTPAGNAKVQSDISDAMKGQLPPAWADALKEYYKKLGQE